MTDCCRTCLHNLIVLCTANCVSNSYLALNECLIKTGQISASQCSVFFFVHIKLNYSRNKYGCYILSTLTFRMNLIIRFLAPLSRLTYNYADRRRHLIATNWSIFMRLTHICVYHFCANNPDLKYGWKTSVSALTKDLFSRINIYPKTNKNS